MVSSQLAASTDSQKCRPFMGKLFFPVTQDAVVSDNVELDFSDVFGPVPTQPTLEVNVGDSGKGMPASDVSELVYNDPVVVYSRSHSLVGPSSYIAQSLKHGMDILRESDESGDLVKCVGEETIKEHPEATNGDTKNGLYLEGDAKEDVDIQSIGVEDFEILKVVGQGAFGRVYQVRKKGTADIYAMKVMRKDKIMEKNQAEYMKAERDILTKIDHPFIVQLRYSFQTKYRLYLVLDFINGGHLFFQLYHHGLFREDLARIYAAEIVSAVSHLHANGVMHRDLKPENVLLDAEGHVVLTDFGLAKEFEENARSNSMCGTVEYMPPEIVLGKGHDKAADWWSVGVLLFEMLTGKPPFIGGNREKIQQKIVKDKVKLPSFLTSEAHSILKGLLQKEANRRLGSGATGSEEIKSHKWFKAINWKKLESRGIHPSFCPEVEGSECIANFEKRWTEMSIADSPAASPTTAAVNPFSGFTYVRPPPSFLLHNKAMATTTTTTIDK